MIVYFSATGNSEYAAKRLAEALGDTAVPMTDCGTDIDASVLGIVTPVYSWTLPCTVTGFLSALEPKRMQYVYFVYTYGTTTGCVEHITSKLIDYDASFGVRMPDTWTPLFDLSDKEKVRAVNDAEDEQINFIARKVSSRERGSFVRHRAPSFMAAFAPRIYDGMRKTSHFRVLDSCTGCGKCEKGCPNGSVIMTDGKPEWITDRCTMCLKCLHRCPAFAIQYGRKTEKHGQYVHP